MLTVGFPKSTKMNEKRRAILPEHLRSIKNKKFIYIEEGYGHDLGYSDDDYASEGANVVSSHEVFKKDIICDPKVGDADYLAYLGKGKILFGYIHAVQNREITDAIINNSNTAIAWEDMYEKGRHVFWKNNEIAGEAAILHAFITYGRLPFGCRVAVIGRGNTARGACRILGSLGADITVYDRRTERLLREEIGIYDVIVNCVLWDTDRRDHIIYKEDLKRMKPHAMIIDISCDRAGAIETSIPTTINEPVYKIDDIIHYAVDHTPSLLYRSATKSFGDQLVKYLDYLIENKFLDNLTLKNALIIEKGKILDERIIRFQGRDEKYQPE